MTDILETIHFSPLRYKRNISDKFNFYKCYLIIKNKKNRIINMRLHRKNGPAEVFEGNKEYWFSHGFSHRTDGPFTNDTDHWDDFNRWQYKNIRMSEEPYWNY